MRHALALAGFLAVTFAAAAAGGMANARAVAEWYPTLAKPVWTPPAWIFGPVWMLLYTLMGTAAWLVWLRQGFRGARLAHALYVIQLALNAAWSWLFFGFRLPGAAFVEILLLLASIGATTILFWKARRSAGMLFIPYLVWVFFATVLNLAIWRMNADSEPGVSCHLSGKDINGSEMRCVRVPATWRGMLTDRTGCYRL
jgi:tryptophan-rich sensory protein